MAGGRPTEYNEEILTKTREYLENCKEAVPSIAGLARHLGISRDTIYDWASQDEKKEFSDTLDDILAEQEKVLVDKGLRGEYNSNIVKLMLANHGHKEVSDHNVSIGWQNE